MVAGWHCLVVGGGKVAARRAERLAESGARVTVVAPEMVESIPSAPVERIERPYRREDLDGVRLVVTATGLPEVDEQVALDAREAGILLNDATDPSRSNLVVPAITTLGQVTVAVDTAGASPALARWLLRRIEADLAEGLDELVELLSSVRVELVAQGRPTEHPGWADALDEGLVDLVRAGNLDEARRRLRVALGLGGTST